MSVLSGKNLLLGISAGIAAYKSAHLVRLFVKAGANVQVIMTPAAKDFITPLTLATLSKNPVYSTFFDENNENAVWNNHVDLAIWADLIVIAPATANTIAKIANGVCDNLLMATYLSSKSKVFVAPAMDLDMYQHQTTKANFEALQKFGNIIIPAEKGELASGLVGEGRMAEPENIVSFIEADLAKSLPLRGKKILVTAGPTYEAIDPVRFIGNHSSGKMGFDIAHQAAQYGAEVILISGPTHCQIKSNQIQLIAVTSAQEMFEACHKVFDTVDAAIAAAAVADYKPKWVAQQKIKKNDDSFTIELEKTKDILASMGAIKKNQFLVGFALETENEIEHAKLKIQKKNLDLIVLNSLNDIGAGFGKSTNKVTFINQQFEIESHELKSKEAVALDIINKIIAHYNE
ncbi:phosphopantothenoylcysteine decarboxylase [Flavobacterium branchiophilum NBRC 15030 = ATCC 35035]|uniref:Coenzyme A biosynthesis bifunctional protein CoaBC n=1 Tax=Flavobacterium branchiophilum TaxID=55197 RepID=A0A543G8H6_9FLAO|nr:bifunctional phosphopantothenoylcysteine decarboxylase/phosphopantothenate--cysteine ligase CoaBC [Flavobacterium branchiophilum]OXA74190.1 phosphopantothenoylcysteine decarboxylase [Flavobacterium branchiophilum NBRC 15030 = ATCC 35035]TQM42386.1 phosphopantothenoylcysteine decarboxylase/phosphopantothenate--cysteine ligase [Flavobacterium branchiophilum]GEM54652.1 phosphopantothenoylcysteine decarboxylase [Flavobacterium branchiophilum NBRC 15030 = ATCC 35035]